MKSVSTCRINKDKVKYSAVKLSEDVVNLNLTEKSPLLENVEKLSISAPALGEQTSDSMAVTLPETSTRSETNTRSETEVNDSKKDSKPKSNGVKNAKSGETCTDTNKYHGARPKVPVPQNSGSATSGGNTEVPNDNSIDIVRKMSQPLSNNYVPWRQIGPYQELRLKRCHRLHAATGRADDLALFFHNGRFYVMEAWCTHMGGPLFEGDIEDYNGKCHVMCPWHSYMFDLETGKNEIGLQQTVHDLKLESGHIYVRYHTDISTQPSRKASQPTGPRVINRPPEGKHEKMRKQSVLDTPLKLS